MVVGCLTLSSLDLRKVYRPVYFSLNVKVIEYHCCWSHQEGSLRGIKHLCIGKKKNWLAGWGENFWYNTVLLTVLIVKPFKKWLHQRGTGCSFVLCRGIRSPRKLGPRLDVFLPAGHVTRIPPTVIYPMHIH